MDGVYASYCLGKKLTLSDGYASLTPAMWDETFDTKLSTAYTPALVGNVRYQMAPDVTLTAGLLRTLSSATDTDLNYVTNKGVPQYEMEQYAIGVDVKVAKNVRLTGEWLTNRADSKFDTNLTEAQGKLKKEMAKDAQDNGWWLRLSAGNYDRKKAHTFDTSLYYMNLGNWAIDSHYAPHGLPIRGGNGLGRDGEKGFGIGFRYMFAPYVELFGSYFRVKPYDSGASGFDRYADPWQLALNYSF